MLARKLKLDPAVALTKSEVGCRCAICGTSLYIARWVHASTLHSNWRLIMSLGTILLIILIIALLGGFSGIGGGPFYGTGYYGGGGLGLVLIIVLILVLLGRI